MWPSCGSRARSGTPSAGSRAFFVRSRVSSIVFDVDLIYLARKRGYRIKIVPIQWADRRGSRMHARLGLALRVGWDLIRIRFVHGRIERVQPGAAGAVDRAA